MKKKKIKCPNCNKEILYDSRKESIVCDYCTMNFLPKDILNKKKFTLHTFFKILFIISLFYYVYWIGAALHQAMLYGYYAFHDKLGTGFLFTIVLVWYVPLYQFIYILVYLIKKSKQNRK